MNITPHPKRIVVNIETRKTTEAGLILTGHDTNLEYGTVLAVGKDVQDVQVGDMLYFKDWSLDKIEKDGTKVVFVSDEDYLGFERL